MNSTFTAETLRSVLSTTLLGRRIEIHPQVGSTNDLIREAGRRGEPEGLVIAAEEQLAGRGRRGRAWTAPSGCCILCSVLLRPRFSAQYAFYLTIAASLAIRRAIYTLRPQTSDLSPAIKWPNDILLGGKKVAGVLCESELAGSDWAFAVVGFGINVNLTREQLGELRAIATSLSAEYLVEIDRASLLAGVLNELENLYLALQRGDFGAVFEEWAAAIETIGKHVVVREGSEELTGDALWVDADGALVVRLESGEERRVLAGDVTLSQP